VGPARWLHSKNISVRSTTLIGSPLATLKRTSNFSKKIISKNAAGPFVGIL
jgi:hypothetical protein